MKIGALWCPECLIMRPRWLEIQKRQPDLQIEEIDIDERPDIKQQHKIDHIPTVIFFDKDNNEYIRLRGLFEMEDLLAKIIELKNI